jgi:hypothetical protein
VIEQPENNYWSSGIWCYFKNTKPEFSEHNIINNQISEAWSKFGRRGDQCNEIHYR